ncbi:unnamed protein product [Dracunculus medinensis]|uniref:Coiled-coil domain-containing protein 25 n=1 Tax=Dracunculus medinensis TaxID=318479 RepID=A0A0N4UJC1_DRAME|nr:unnamed protein product [Dracunculus medinensis]
MILKYFTSDPICELHVAYEEQDKDEYVKEGCPKCIFFRVEGFHSAHIYLKLRLDLFTFQTIPRKVLEECTQLTLSTCRFNREKKLNVLYTPWENLVHLPEMGSGHIAFRNSAGVRSIYDIEFSEEILNRIRSSDSFVDLKAKKTQHSRDYASRQYEASLDIVSRMTEGQKQTARDIIHKMLTQDTREDREEK